MSKSVSNSNGGLLLGAPSAFADAVGPGNYCVQTNLGVSKLNCTANDTNNRLSVATGVTPTECLKDQPFLLNGTFVLATNATARYDVGITFSSDGDPNGDGAKTGSCSRNTVPVPPASNLDGDSCGDLTSAGSPYNVVVTDLSVTCADTDGDGFVNLPYIIGWKQTGSNDCQNAAQALPGTTSKCIVDDTFNIPVHVRLPGGNLSKTATVVVTYNILINNTGETDLTLQNLTDSVYGDILSGTNTAIQSTTCVDNHVIPAPVSPATSSYACNFKVGFDASNPGSTNAVVDTVTASGVDNQSNSWGGTSSSFEDGATVTVFVQ